MACSLTPKDLGKSHMFNLSSVDSVKYKKRGGTLIINLPISSLELDTFRIALQRNGNVQDYYAGARWVEFLPSLVQDSLVKSIESSSRFNNVTSDDTVLRGDYALKTEIRSFHAIYTDQKAPQIKISLMVTLRNQNTHRNVKSFTVTGTSQAENSSLSSIQKSFDEAFNQAQKKILRRL